jgi:hypothetical protein
VLTFGKLGPGCGLTQCGEPYLQSANAGVATNASPIREEATRSVRVIELMILTIDVSLDSGWPDGEAHRLNCH